MTVLATLALVGCGSSSSSSSSAAVKGPSEVAAAPVSTPGANPFTATVGKDKAGVTPPAAAASASGGPATYNASLPGLYGGTRNHASCDAVKLVNFLEQNPSKASAWASTLGIQTTQIQDYVSGLTDVILRTDTRVTNHGYVNGVANPLQSLLEAGTAVFVDKYGRPVVKCYCGNPLTPPVLYTTPSYTGPLWASFSPTQITIINQSTTIINNFTLYDPNTGMTFSRTPGAHGRDGPYTGTQTSSTTQSQSTTSAAHTSNTTQQQAPQTPAAENPSVSLSPNPVTQGGIVTLSASGFAPNAGLQITVVRPDQGTDHFSMSTMSDGTGTYTFTNAGANVSLGTYNVTVSNPATGAQASASVDVQGASTDTTTSSTTT